VIKIQAVIRGGVVRCKVRKWHTNATVLQRTLARGNNGRKTAANHAFLILRVECAARRWLARQRLKRIHKSAAFVQAHVRRRQSTKRFQQAFSKVVLLQSLGRRKCAMAYLLRLHAGASALQAVFFGLKARQQLLEAKLCCAVVQALLRGVLVRQGWAK
jgi:hypothetical protein